MKNRKMGLRIALFLSVLIFLLIPLLSNPVAAAHDCSGMSLTTSCGSSGITITFNDPTILSFTDSGSGSGEIIVNCDLDFANTFPPNTNSITTHDAMLSANLKPGYTSLDGDEPNDWEYQTLYDGETFVDGTALFLVISYYNTPCEWELWLEVEVKETSPGSNVLQDTEIWDLEVI